MGLVEEEHELGLVGVAHFGQSLEQFRQHPQQESGIQARRLQQPVGRQDVDHPFSAHGLHQIADIKHRFAKKAVAALGFDLQQTPLDGAYAGGADIAVCGRELLAVVTHILQQGAQIFHVQQQQAVVVGNAKHDVEHASLRVVQVEHARQQQGTHVADGGAHRMALLAKNVPQRGRAGHGGGQINAAFLEYAGHLAADVARLADAGEVALDIGQKHRHADLRKRFGQFLQGNGLAGTCCTGDQPMAVGQARQDGAGNIAVPGNQNGVGHGESLKLVDERCVPVLGAQRVFRPGQSGQYPVRECAK